MQHSTARRAARHLSYFVVAAIAAALAAFFASAPFSAASAPSLTVILHRVDGRIELFLRAPAADISTIFGASTEILADENGAVDFDDLRFGTWPIAQELAEHVDVDVGGAPAVLEPMSLMVHLDAWAPPFETPIDGMTAISVCGGPDPDAPPRLSELTAFAGYVLYVDDPSAAVSVSIPLLGEDAIAVEIRDYVDFEPTGVSHVSLAAREPLLFESPR